MEKTSQNTLKAPTWWLALLVILGLSIVGGAYFVMQLQKPSPFTNTPLISSNPVAVATHILPSPKTTEGLVITDIMQTSPADQAGLEVGDLILAVDQKQFDNVNDLVEFFSAYQPGEKISLTVQHSDGTVQTLVVELGQDPRDETKAVLGIEIQSILPNMTPEEDLNQVSGVIQLVSREITADELTELAPFTVLWPQDLPEQYQLVHVMEMSESWTESSGTGIFVLEYINAEEQQASFSMWQYLGITQSLPSLEGKQIVSSLSLPDEAIILLYEGEEGQSMRTFLQYNQVNVEFEFRNIPLDDIEIIISTLSPN